MSFPHPLVAVNDLDFQLIIHRIDALTGVDLGWLQRRPNPQHQSPKRQVVKHIAAVSPHIRASIFPMTLVIEAIHRCNLPGLMVPSYQRDSIWVSDLEAEEEHEALEGVEAAIDEVAHEEVIGVGNIATHTE